MAHLHRLILALGFLLALPIVSGWGLALAAGSVSEFGEQPTPGLSVVQVRPAAEEPLMPGGSHGELLAISTEADSVYAFTLRLSSREQNVERLRVRIEDVGGWMLYDGPATRASFSGRLLAAGQTDWLWVRVYAPTTDEGLVPGATISQSWTVTAQASQASYSVPSRRQGRLGYDLALCGQFACEFAESADVAVHLGVGVLD